jgi:pimeloyl-ACP methyl ester carboxylesterase
MEAANDEQRNDEAAAAYYAGYTVDPAALTRLAAPVLLIAGEYDVQLPPKRAAEYAAMFPNAELAALPRAGHFPWVDDPEWLVTAVARFLG